MKLSLTDFQDAFISALYDADSSALNALTQQPGFSVYRNTVMKGASDALLANFPTVVRLVGDDWLRAAASIYLQQSPPSDTRLLYYGASFPDFLDWFEHAQQMPYLGNVARLDWLWTQVHSAQEQPPLETRALARLSPERLLATCFQPRASVAWAWFTDQPAYSIWRLNREELDIPPALEWHSEGVLLTRDAGRINWQSFSAAGCTLLDACAANLPLGSALEQTQERHPDLDPNQLLAFLISANVLLMTDRVQ